MDHLSERQRQALTTFQEISQVSDQDLAIQILQENQWNIDLAVENFMSFGGGSSRRNRSSGNRSPALTERSSPRLSANRAETSRETEHENGNQENTPPSNSIFDSILSRLKWLYQGQLQSRNPDLDTRKFIGQFELNYSTQHPAFHNRGYQSAVARAFETSKFLLVYLHSPMHEDSQKFIQQTFCTQSFSAFADQHVITWIGNVWDEQAYTLGNQLRVTQFPFLALLLCQSDRMVKVIARQEGHIEEADLIDKLRNAISVNTVVVNQIQAEATRRREFSALREQQDREYRELEEQDRRERERREQEEREAIRREHEEQQRRELEAAMELSNRLNYEGDMQRRKRELGDEPPANQSDVAVIRFQLPQGAKLSRRFVKSDTVQKLYDFLLVHFFDQGLNIKNISVATHFPKVELTDMSQTLEANGLHPRGMLYVQDLDA